MMAFLAALPDPKWMRFYTVAFGTELRPSEQFALEGRTSISVATCSGHARAMWTAV
jgi:hypothetical protein